MDPGWDGGGCARLVVVVVGGGGEEAGDAGALLLHFWYCDCAEGVVSISGVARCDGGRGVVSPGDGRRDGEVRLGDAQLGRLADWRPGFLWGLAIVWLMCWCATI